ncbi:CBM35 domain-containing protein [[Ruminococcus] torques]|uniref:CBM35 domain-containing protein n=1 Tax=[Ruminococcus] torques TaxID=33039 RepID=UPI0027BB11ED|nr:CBM35 domain-containing protein [[Ruminococcus] torques]
MHWTQWLLQKTTLYDAKKAELANGAKVEGDYVGGMYGEDAAITFTVDVPSDGNYAVDLCYADNHGAELKKYATIYVNGEKVSTSALFPTGGWDVSGNRIDNIYLKKGENIIAYVNHKVDGENTADVNYYSIALSETVTNTYRPEKDSTFTVNAESEAIYDVTFTYNNGETDNANVILNGEENKQFGITFGDNQNTTVALKLKAGMNTLKFEGAEATSVYISRRTPWIYQAENAELNGVKQENNHLYYNGIGFVSAFESVGNSVKFITNIAYSGTHTINLKYSCVSDADRTISLYINGQKVKQITLQPTESWDEWKEIKEEVYLRSGKNVVEFRVDEGDSGNLNIDEIIIDKYATGATTADTAKLISGEVYVLKDKNSSLSADIDSYSPDAGREIHLWYYLGNNNQKWKLVDIGNGYWAFQGTYGSKRFSVKPDEIDGKGCYTAVTAEADKEDYAQQWKTERVGSCYKLINRKVSEEMGKDMVLSVYKESKTAGAKLYLAPYENKDSQLFSIDGGIRLDNTEVQENASEQSAEEYASYGSQYELADPVIPEGYDPSIPVKDGNALRYEAENAALENGAVKSTNHTGYSGDAFVEGMWNGDASVTFKINVEIAGKYTLALGYSNGYAETESERAAATYLNGTLAAPTLLPSTGFNDWDSWGESEFTLELQEGVNTIVFRNRKEDADGLQGDVNYDYLDVMKYPNTVSAEETKYTPLTDATGKRYEAEDAELSGSGVETEHNGFSGEGYVGKMYNGSAKIGFQAAVKETGEYTLQLRYANGHGEDVEDKYAAVFINGKYVEALELPKTGSWDEWKMTKPLKVNLNEGVSTIAFVNSSYHAGHSADVNYDYLDLITEQGTEQKEYSVTVGNGTATPNTAAEGTKVTIKADEAEEGMVFDKWIVESGKVVLEDPESAETTFVMGISDVVVNAVYKEISVYEIIEGENLSVIAGAPAVFISNAEFSKFKEVRVDGTILENDHYDAENCDVKEKTGLTKVTLKESYIESLSLGSHTIEIVSEDGSASTKFTVSKLEEAVITLLPKEAEVKQGDTLQFTAEITGIDDKSVIWNIEGAKSENTNISELGLLSVGEDETAKELLVKVVAKEDNTLSALAKVLVKNKETLEPGEPSEPDDQPSEPDDQPSEPDNQPSEPDNQPFKPDKQSSESSDQQNSAVKTGDANYSTFLYVLIILSFVGFCGMTVYKKTKKD